MCFSKFIYGLVTQLGLEWPASDRFVGGSSPSELIFKNLSSSLLSMGVKKETIEKCKKTVLFILEEHIPKTGTNSCNFEKLKDFIEASNFIISTSLKELQEEGKVVARIKEAEKKELEYFATKNITSQAYESAEKFHTQMQEEIRKFYSGLGIYGEPKASVKHPPYSLSTYLAWRTFLRNKKTSSKPTGWNVTDDKKIWEKIKAEKTSSDGKIVLMIEVLNARMPTEERKSRYRGEYDKFTIQGRFMKEEGEIERVPATAFGEYLDYIIKSFGTLVERTQVLDSYAKVIAGYSKWDYDNATEILNAVKEFPHLEEEYERIIKPMFNNFFNLKFSKLNESNRSRLSECFMYMDMRIQEVIDSTTKYMTKNV